MRKNYRNKFYSKGEHQPFFLRGLALGVVIMAGIFAVYLSVTKTEDEIISETAPSIDKITQAPSPKQTTISNTPAISPFEENIPEVKKVLLSENQALEKIPELSPHPLIQNWLSTEEYLRKTIALVDNIAQYKFLKKDLSHFILDEKFKIINTGDKIVLDTAGYERFNQMTNSIVTIDSALLIDIFQAMEPKIQSFYDELGNTDKSFRSTLLAAIQNIQNAPLIYDPIILVRPNVFYKFADPELESMPTLNKQFIRLGPINTLLIQKKLKEISELIEQTPPTQNNI